MDRKQKIHDLLHNMADELLAYIKEQEHNYEDGWVPAVHVKRALDLNFMAVPKQNKQYGEKGWLLQVLARMLEDKGLLLHKKLGNRAFYRSQ